MNLIYFLVNEINTNGQNINFYLRKICQYLNKYKFDNNKPKKLLKLILGNLHKDSLNENEININDKITMNELKAFECFNKNKYKTSKISKLYTGTLKKILCCINCKKKYYKFKTFKVISIDIDIGNKYLNFKDKLYNDNFTREIESKKYSCFNCKKRKFSILNNFYYACPEVLIICFDKKSENIKNSFNIDLFLELDMNKYIEKKDSKNDYKYILNSFIEYDKKQIEYISYINFNNNIWRKMNKENTYEININDKKNIINPQILFYEKI